MVVSYKGKDPNYSHRVAEITYDEDKEQNKLERIQKVMKIQGWDIDIITPGYAICEVDDMDTYKVFVEDWKKVKQSVALWTKYGI